MPKEKKTFKGREVKECKDCGAEFIDLTRSGKKVAINVVTKKGFVFIEDEYGEEIGSPEMIEIHERHSETCTIVIKDDSFDEMDMAKNAKKVRMTVGLIEPLNEDDERIETLTLEDGSNLELDKAMRLTSRKEYENICGKSHCRVFVEDKKNAKGK